MLQGFVPALRHLQSCLERQDEASVLPPPPDPLLAHRFSRRTSPAGPLPERPRCRFTATNVFISCPTSGYGPNRKIKSFVVLV